MKKLLAVMLLIVLLCQALPVQALAGVGKMLTRDEIARARALTGLSFGNVQKAENLYHTGMKPNADWNAKQLRGWRRVSSATRMPRSRCIPITRSSSA